MHELDGHNHLYLLAAINESCDGPKVIIAKTTKGSGVSFMENSVLWHYRSPNSTELDSAIDEVLAEK